MQTFKILLAFKKLNKSLSKSFSIIPNNALLNSIKKSGRIKRILMTGGNGQLGTEILPYLNQLYGANNILVTDISEKKNADCKHYEHLDVLDRNKVESTIKLFKPDYIIHFAAKLSASGELDPKSCLKVNIDGFKNVIDVACEKKVGMFLPSTIGAFGSSTPKHNAPNTTIMRPSTVYGCSKVFNELLGTYYKHKYGMDFRSLRYSQTISCTKAFGGSGDYSIEIFYGALKKRSYTCYLKAETKMSFLYINDLIEGTLKMMETDSEKLSECVYNIQSCSFTVKELADEIKKHIPEFRIDYQIDFRQKIVDTWPESLDDSLAKQDWNYSPKFNIEELTKEMINLVGKKIKAVEGDI